LGDVVEVYGVATTGVWNLDRSEDNGIAILKNAQGKHAVLQATWSEWKGYRFHIEAYGDRGMARASYAPMMSMSVTMDKPGGARRFQRNFYPANILREKMKGWQSTVIRGFQQEYQDFTALCGGKRNIIADGFAGFRAVEIAHAVYRCNTERAAIRLSDPF
jgi:predicted dehydrogenase